MFWVRKIVDDLWKLKFQNFYEKCTHRFNEFASSGMIRESSRKAASIRFAAIYLNLYLQTIFNLCLSIFLAGQQAQGRAEAAKKTVWFQYVDIDSSFSFSHSHRNTLRKNAAIICGKFYFLFRRSSQNKAGVFHSFSFYKYSNFCFFGGKETHILCCPKIKFQMTREINYCIFAIFICH